jgi:site-specific DNA-methyltransferase (adenine-specific)
MAERGQTTRDDARSLPRASTAAGASGSLRATPAAGPDKPQPIPDEQYPGPWKRREVIGRATLFLGDCREIAPTLGPVDLIFTDPPYGDAETHSSHLSGVTLRDGTPARQALGFAGISQEELCSLASGWVEQARRWVVFTCEWKHAHALPHLVRLGIWRKPDGAPQFTGDRPGMGWEAIAICHREGRKRWNGGGKHAVWTVPKRSGDGHPTQKPTALVGAWISDFAEAGEIILDPFMGSGTTGVAAVQMRHPFIGIEIEERYFDIACRRIAEAQRQGDLFRDAVA